MAKIKKKKKVLRFNRIRATLGVPICLVLIVLIRVSAYEAFNENSQILFILRN